MKYPFFFLLLCLPLSGAFSQTVRSLDECLTAADAYLPLTRQTPLIEASNRAAQTNLKRNYWPQISLNGQATWQTDVTSLPIKISLPGFEVPTISQDQYRLTLEVAQTIWDGGQNSGLRAVQESQTGVELQKVAVDRFNVREQVIQMYCAALLAQTHYRTLDAAKADVRTRIARAQEQLSNGTAIPAQVYAFEARLLEIEQQQEDALARKSIALDGLSRMTNISFAASDSLRLPAAAGAETTENMRPELSLFARQQALTASQERLSKAKLMPRVNFFTTLGYGRPGLNMLSNDFDPYALVGLNFKWNLHPLYTGSANREKQQLRLQSERIAAQRDQYLLQNSVAQQQQIREIERINNLLVKDQRIVSLRDNMVETAGVQLENGVITSSEYLTETTNATTARMNARLHEIQLLQAKLMLGYLNGK